MLFKISAVVLNEMNRLLFFFSLFCFVWVCLFCCFHTDPLTRVHVTDVGAAAAPLEQSPAVKVPCWRALWQWLLREDWAFLDLFTFVQGIKPVTFSSSTVTTFLLLLWPTSHKSSIFNLILYVWFFVLFSLWCLVMMWSCRHLQIFLYQ